MNNIHSVTDKALFDALSQPRVTTNELRDLYLERGILVSKATDKKELAKNFSKFSHDFHLHQKIAAIFGGFLRREKNTSVLVKNEISRDVMLEAADQLKKELESQDDLCHVIADKNIIRIHITYLSTNYGKSDFCQVEKKTAVFEIEKQDLGYSIRRPDNDQAKVYESNLLKHVEKLCNEVESENNFDLNLDEISLSNIDDAEKRTEFFTRLINGLEGFTLHDVTDAYVYHPKPKVIEEEDGDTDSGVHISKASLKGEGVLKSEELTSLYQRGFYIWKIRWKVLEQNGDPDMYEFEAQFSDPLDFTGFSYISRGYKKYKGAGEYNKNASPLSDNRELYFKRLIESTARSIIDNINEEYE
ncbi:hypothetical protein EHN07_19110 [Buttiauxella warmboldiae]|uniref:Uncharacterized protein n=1 Tax=Buttiauxella warmboldiae TaxID=82993 RepID=A0A3N5DKA9_9ENTR|nr:hypothetical protein [Buttiauxella warmboldiae]RPH20931.1 hypothetical protein EHN07_19110 [Buttiauxella warmboldiae]